MAEDVTPLKGFRTLPKPTKGEVEQENKSLVHLLNKRLTQVQSFLSNLIQNVMRQTQDLSKEMNGVSAWLGSASTTEAAQAKDNLLIDYAGMLLNEDESPATIEIEDVEGNKQSIPDFFDGGSGKFFMLINLTGGTLIPGFEEQLIGLKATESREIKVKFPEGYQVKSLAGRLAQFTVYVHDVRRPLANSPVGDLIDANDAIRAAARSRAQQKAVAAAQSAQASTTEQASLDAGTNAADSSNDDGSQPGTSPESSPDSAAPTSTSAETQTSEAEVVAQVQASAGVSGNTAPEATEVQATEAPAESAAPAAAEQTSSDTGDTGSGAEQSPAST